MSTLDEKLQPWTSDRINDYVRLLYGRSTVQRKQDRIDAICRQLLEPASLADVWSRLDELSRRAVSTAFHNGGEWDESAFIAQYGARPTAPADGRSIFSYYRQPILFDLFVLDSEIPEDLMPGLAALVLPRETFQPEGLDELPAEHQTWHGLEPLTQVGTEKTGRADLLAYLHLVEQKGLSWSRSNGQLTATSVRKLYANLSAADYYEKPAKMSVSQVIRPVGLDLFARGAGLVTSYGALTPAGRQFRQSQDPELFLTAFEEWTTSNQFDELTRITQLRGLKGRGTRLTKPGSRREKIIEALSWCPTGVWIRCQEFFRAVKIWQFDFEVERGDWTNLYVGSYRDYGEMIGETYWQVVKGLYIKAILMEQLATIGAVDIAYVDGEFGEWPNDLYVDGPLSPYDGLLYFRINPWGAFLFGQGEAYRRADTSPDTLFIIDEGRRLRPARAWLPHERIQIEVLATPAGEDVYELTNEKLLTAVAAGQTLEQIDAFLSDHHQGPLPPTISAWLAELQGNLGAFKVGPQAVKIKLNAVGLDLLKRDPELARLCQPLDDGHVLVLQQRLTRFRNRLRALGFLLET